MNKFQQLKAGYFPIWASNETLSRYFSCALLFLLLSFFFIDINKTRNTLFYITYAVPALLVAARFLFDQPPHRIFTALLLFLAAYTGLLWVVDGVHVRPFKYSLYLIVFYVGLQACVANRRNFDRVFLAFAAVCTLVALYAVIDWAIAYLQSGTIRRYRLELGMANPIHEALVLMTGWLGFWLVYALPKAREKGRMWWCGALFFVFAFALLITTAFQSRSALAGLMLVFMAYLAVQKDKKALMLIVAVVVIVAAVLAFSGVGEALLNRGTSYRLEIWTDAWLRVINDCSWLVGCGKEADHLYAGQFHHAHSAYLSIFVDNGFLGVLVFAVFALLFLYYGLQTRSPWFVLSMLGWGGVLANTNGVINSPNDIWVYFWVPTFLAMLHYAGKIRE